MKAPFSFAQPVRFRSGDPAGISFFANVYPMAHDVFEDFVKALGFEYKFWFQNPDWATPIRRSECDYFEPLWPGSDVKVIVTLDRLGETAMTLKYTFKNGDRDACVVTLVHAFLDLKKRVKTEIPSVVRDRLQAYQRECLGT